MRDDPAPKAAEVAAAPGWLNRTDELAGWAPRVIEGAAAVVGEAWGHGDDGAAAARAAVVNPANRGLAEVRGAAAADPGAVSGPAFAELEALIGEAE